MGRSGGEHCSLWPGAAAVAQHVSRHCNLLPPRSSSTATSTGLATPPPGSTADPTGGRNGATVRPPFHRPHHILRIPVRGHLIHQPAPTGAQPRTVRISARPGLERNGHPDHACVAVPTPRPRRHRVRSSARSSDIHHRRSPRSSTAPATEDLPDEAAERSCRQLDANRD